MRLFILQAFGLSRNPPDRLKTPFFGHFKVISGIASLRIVDRVISFYVRQCSPIRKAPGPEDRATSAVPY